MGRGFTVFVYLFAIGVLVAALLLDPINLIQLFSLDELTPLVALEIDALRLLFSLAALMMLLAALIWTFGHSYLFTKQIRDGYYRWVSPVYGLQRSERYWVWRWLLGLWVVVALIVIARSSGSSYGVASAIDSLFLQSGVMGAVEVLSLFVAGVLLVRQAWRDVRSGIAPLGVIGILLGVFLMMAAGEEVGWGAQLIGVGVEEAGGTPLHRSGGIIDYGQIWIQQSPALVFFFYLGFWPALGYIFPQIHFILDRMALPIAPAGLFPIVLVGSVMDDHAIFDFIWNRSGWSMAEGREFILAVSLLMMVLFMRRYRGSVKDVSGSLTFPGRSSSQQRLR